MEINFPDKMFYKIGEVAELTGLEPYVLRYWEGEFNLKLTKSKNQQRLYQKKDIDQIVRIKTLLYDEKFTIAGAKKRLREKRKEKEVSIAPSDGQLALTLAPTDRETQKLKDALAQIREELQSFVRALEESASA